MMTEVNAGQVESNGNIRISVIKLVMALVLMFVTVAGATTPAVVSMARMSMHVADAERHESADQKSNRIDSRVDLHLKPIEVRLEEMAKDIREMKDLLKGA